MIECGLLGTVGHSVIGGGDMGRKRHEHETSSTAPNFRSLMHLNSGPAGESGKKTPKAKPASETMRSVARANLRARRIRRHHLPESLFGEPAFDMLLALYLSDQGGSRQTTTRLVKYSGAPMSTALRWVDYLVRAGLVARRANPVDRRVAFIELTDKGLASIEAYLAELISEGIATPLDS